MDVMLNTPDKNIIINSDLKTKGDILKHIAHISSDYDCLSEYSEKDIYKALKEREELLSTGFENGIAIPHCNLEKATDFVFGLITKPNGIDFESMDGKPTRLIFFIIGPKNQRNKHIKLLSTISRLFKSEKAVKEILQKSNAEEIKSWIRNKIDIKDKSDISTDKDQYSKNLYHIFVQEDDLFHNIVEILSSYTEGSLVILESINVSYYMNKMPLFSSYWTDNEKKYSKLIIAAINKAFSNDLIRRINALFDSDSEKESFFIAVQELAYTDGKINF